MTIRNGESETLPRALHLGPLRLDLFHRDAEVKGRWLGLHPKEFALLWLLAQHPGRRWSRMALLCDIWRLDHDPETNRVAVTVARVRSKLAPFGLSHLVVTDMNLGAYYLDPSSVSAQ